MVCECFDMLGYCTMFPRKLWDWWKTVILLINKDFCGFVSWLYHPYYLGYVWVKKNVKSL